MSLDVFADSSVLVALLAKEPGRERHLAALKNASRRFTSSLAVVESVMVLSSIMSTTPTFTERVLRAFLEEHSVVILDIGDLTASEAIKAFEKFGKGRHPARLNLGDCVTYACAKQHRLHLLYKGEDFARTDLG